MADSTGSVPGTPGPDPSEKDLAAGKYVPAAEPGPPIGGSRRGAPAPGRATPPPPVPPGGSAAATPTTSAEPPAQPASSLRSGVPVADQPTAAAGAEPRPSQPGPPRAEKHATPPRWAVQDVEPPAGGAGTAGGSATPPPRPKAQDSFSLMLDQIGYLLMDVRDWARQETEFLVRDKVARPMTEVSVMVGSFTAAMILFVVGMLFVATAGIVWLSFLVGVPLAFLIIGAALLIGSGVFLGIKARQLSRSTKELKRATAMHEEGLPNEPTPTKAKKPAPAAAPKPEHAPPVPTNPPGV